MTDDRPIEISTIRTGRWLRVSVAGELDMATVSDLEAVIATQNDHLAVDLSSVRFIDSSGLRALLSASQSSQEMVILSPSAVVRRLLSLTDMDQVFTVIDDPAALPE